jgi:hypothetical protein
MNISDASRRGLPTRFQELLDQNRDVVFVYLNAQLNDLLGHTDEAMMDFAGQAQSNTMQGRFFEAMAEVRNYRGDIEHRFRTAILDGFTSFLAEPAVPAKGADSPEELTLLEPDETEEFVVGEKLVIKYRNNYFTQLYALRQRLAVLNQGRKVTEAQTPAGPNHLVRAFREAISDLHVDMKPKIVLYALYDKFVLRQLQGLYEELNDNLKEAGILPNLRPVAYTPGNQSDAGALERESGEEGQDVTEDEPSSDLHHQDIESRIADPGGAGRVELHGRPIAAPAQHSSLGEDLFDSILELMSRRPLDGGYVRENAGVGPWEPPAPATDGASMPHASPTGRGRSYTGGAAISHQQLLSAVDRIRPPRVGGGQGVLFNLEALPQLVVDPQFLDKVKQALSHEREQIFSQVSPTEIPPIDANTIDLIGMLFEYMLNDPLLPNVAKALLSHLHTPYLKVSLIDYQLLVDSEHPARLLLDLLVEAGGLWVYENDIKRGIFPQMQEVVDRVLQEYSDSSGLFSELLEYFRAAMDEQRRKSDAIERRSQDAIKGKERLVEAKRQAVDELKNHIGRVRLPKSVERFLTQTWTDRLVFILLRHKEKEHSPEWRRALRVVDDLVWLFATNSAGATRRTIVEISSGILSEIKSALESLGGYQQHNLDDLSQLLNSHHAIKDWHRQAQTAPYSEPPLKEGDRLPDASVARTQAPTITAASKATAAPHPPPEKTTAPSRSPSSDKLSAHERTMVNKLQHIRFGTWFEFKDPDGSSRRLKLSWVSPLTSKCMFVDQLGIQVEVRELTEIARMLANGQARVLPQPRRQFVQRALISIKNALQRSMEATN